MKIYETISEYAECCSEYSAEEIHKFVARIVGGIAAGMTVNAICRQRGMPSNVWMWQLHMQCAEASHLIDRARLSGAHAMVDQSIDVAMQADEKTANLARVRSQALQWAASRFNRRKFGDHVTHEVTGAIDLRAAIAAGDRRAQLARPIRDLEPAQIPQLIENKEETDSKPDDAESPSLLEAVKDYRPKQTHAPCRAARRRKAQRLNAPPDEADPIPW